MKIIMAIFDCIYSIGSFASFLVLFDENKYKDDPKFYYFYNLMAILFWPIFGSDDAHDPILNWGYKLKDGWYRRC